MGWVYLNPFVAAPDPFVSDLSNPGPHSGANYYRDGAVDGYNEIAQTISTTPGATYDVSFWLIETSDRINFASVSPAGSSGNGVDLLFYADLGPLATPEPGSLALLGVGLAGLGLLRRRKAAWSDPQARAHAMARCDDDARWPNRVLGLTTAPGAAASACRFVEKFYSLLGHSSLAIEKPRKFPWHGICFGTKRVEL
jgi:hypothetical protein